MDRSPPQPRDWTLSAASMAPTRIDATYLPRLSQLNAPRPTARLDQLVGSSIDRHPAPSQPQPTSDFMSSHRQPKRGLDLQDGDEESAIDTPSSKRRRRLIRREGDRGSLIQPQRVPDPRIEVLGRTISQEDFLHLESVFRSRGTNAPRRSRISSPAPIPVFGRHSAVERNYSRGNEDDEVEFIGSRSAIDSMAESRAQMPPATPQPRSTAPTQPALQASSSAPMLAHFSSPIPESFDSSPLPAPLPAPRSDRQRQHPLSLRTPGYAAEVGNVATRNDRPNIMAVAQIPPIATQNNEDVRFSTILSITQSLSVLDQIMPTHWIRRGITLHEDLRSWLTIDMQRPNAGSDEAFRNCVCAVNVPRKFYFAGCRHVSHTEPHSLRIMTLEKT